MTFRTWLRRFFGPTSELTTEELGGKHDVDHLPRENRPCKRCGKPVAHPAQEYCGAVCSELRHEVKP